MFFLSPILTIFQYITQKQTGSVQLPTIPLKQVPYRLALLDNVVLIYESFYNQYKVLFLNTCKTICRHSPKQATTHSNRIRRKSFYPTLSIHHMLFLVYILLNLSIVVSIHQNILPMGTLGILPTIISCTYIHEIQAKTFKKTSSTCSPSRIIDPSLINLQTNKDKLCSLSAWQSSNNNTMRLLRFSSSRPICIDTSPSCCISNNRSVFTTFKESTSAVIHGISSGLSIKGIATIQWSVINDDGDEVTIHLHNSLYVRDTPMCLLSPQHMAQNTNNVSDGFLSQGKFAVLTFSGHQRTIHYNSSNNLPIIFLASDFTSNKTTSTYALNSHTVHESVIPTHVPEHIENLTPSQRKLLLFHNKLGHHNMKQIQQFAREGLLGTSNKCISNCDIPLCKACLHGKQHRLPSGTTPLDIGHLNPGDCVSGDQVESSSPRLVPTYKGSPTTARYHAGTLLVDHASRYLFFSPHYSTGSKEAIEAKHRFELIASQFNRTIKRYHTDNGIFASKDFRQSCIDQRQRIKFCGVNAHHQNGIAERHIRTITERARTMLIHAMIQWLAIITETLWPYALRLAIDLQNSMPGASGMTPEEIFTGYKHCNKLSDFHSFGCPIFVLDPTLQQGHKIPCWKPRSRVGVYLGFSPDHASSVPLVLSTTTGLVSPQFHVVYDDNFTTTKCLETNVLPSNWPILLETSSHKYVEADFDPADFTDTTFYDSSIANALPTLPDTPPPFQRESDNNASSAVQMEPVHPASSASQREIAGIPVPQGWNYNHPYQTRFKKKLIANTSFIDDSAETPFNEDLYSAFTAVQSSHPQPSDNEFPFLQQYACAASSNPDVLHYGAMIKDPDRHLFEADMIREIANLLKTGTVEILQKSTISSCITVLPAI
jgi:hypothetical protein